MIHLKAVSAPVFNKQQQYVASFLYHKAIVINISAKKDTTFIQDFVSPNYCHTSSSSSAHCRHTPPYLSSLLPNIPPTSPTTTPEKLYYSIFFTQNGCNGNVNPQTSLSKGGVFKNHKQSIVVLYYSTLKYVITTYVKCNIPHFSNQIY